MWRVYPYMIWLLAIGSLLGWLGGFGGVDWPVTCALIALGNLADLYAVRVQRGMRVSTTHFAAPFAVIAAGPFGGLVAGAGCLVGRFIFNRRDWNTFDIAVNISAASVCSMTWVILQEFSSGTTTVAAAVVTVMVFTLFRSLVNYGWTLQARSNGVKIPSISGQIGKLMLACTLLFTPAVSLFIDERDHNHYLSATLLLALPFVATQFLIRAFGRERDLNDSLEDANISLTESLVNALDARDPYSAGHSVAVAVYARDIATEIGLDPARVQRIYLAGLLHDIGKIAVPDAVLRKPAALTEEEFEEIKKHPVVGEQILAPSQHFEDILPAVRHHHERIDGKGYPDGLADDGIPLDARIIAVADAYNAMTSDRPYRDAMPPELAVRILVQNQGMQHDPYLVTAFKRVVDAHDHDYAVAIGPDFATSQALSELIGGRVEPRDDEDDKWLDTAEAA
jgi:putative nucleotidyltransferase with HDIG domain